LTGEFKINVDKNPELTAQFKKYSTLLYFKNGEIVQNEVQNKSVMTSNLASIIKS
jgi:hypothetical protein